MRENRWNFPVPLDNDRIFLRSLDSSILVAKCNMLVTNGNIKWMTFLNQSHKPKNGELRWGCLKTRWIIQGGNKIVFEAGHRCRRIKITTVRRFDYEFPGTVVNVGINTLDEKSYSLVIEYTFDNILWGHKNGKKTTNIYVWSCRKFLLRRVGRWSKSV